MEMDLDVEASEMAISYNGLWKKLIDKNMNKTQLRLATGISTSTLAKLAKQEPVTLEILEKICNVLDCNIGDVVEFIKDND
jgi:DNA-binding Xre family transcriptional regulator